MLEKKKCRGTRKKAVRLPVRNETNYRDLKFYTSEKDSLRRISYIMPSATPGYEEDECSTFLSIAQELLTTS
jgi:hypothetical protein